MEEASQLCDRTIFIDRGKILAEGSPESLIQANVTRDVVEISGGGQELLETLGRNGLKLEVLPDRVYAYTDKGEDLHRFVTENFPVEQCLLRRGTLEDVFLKLTGRELREP